MQKINGIVRLDPRLRGDDENPNFQFYKALEELSDCRRDDNPGRNDPSFFLSKHGNGPKIIVKRFHLYEPVEHRVNQFR